jgi:beta-glucanase (GH16 family)
MFGVPRAVLTAVVAVGIVGGLVSGGQALAGDTPDATATAAAAGAGSGGGRAIGDAFPAEGAAPTATLTLGVAPIAQSRTGTKDLTPGTAGFSPAHQGAAVYIQQQTADGWVDVLSGKQDARGAFSFAVAAVGADGPYTFRAVSTDVQGRQVASSPARSAAWALKFDENFNSADGTSSFRSIGTSGHANGRICSANDDGQTALTGSSMQLHVSLDPLGVPDNCDLPTGTLDAAVSTRATQSFTYGVFAARIKYQSATGQHGAFWMLPAAGGGANDPATVGTEIDVSEYFGDGRSDGGLQNKVYWTDPDDPPGAELRGTGYLGPATKKILGPGHTPSNGYHVYSVEWTPTEYIFRLDGVETFRTSEGVSQQPEYLLLSLLCSDWEHLKLDADSLPSAMKVDWVRVWQQ